MVGKYALAFILIPRCAALLGTSWFGCSVRQNTLPETGSFHGRAAYRRDRGQKSMSPPPSPHASTACRARSERIFIASEAAAGGLHSAHVRSQAGDIAAQVVASARNLRQVLVSNTAPPRTWEAETMTLDRRTLLIGSASLAATTAFGPVPALAAMTGFRPAGQGGGRPLLPLTRFSRLWSSRMPSGYNRVDYRGVKGTI